MNDNIHAFVATAAECFATHGPIYEFGSYVVAGQEHLGNLRPLFPGREYVGCDMRAGPGVDRIEDLGELTLDDATAGAIVCVNTLEHVFEVRRAADEMLRVLKPGGMIVITTPFDFHIHAHPDDYWRLTPSCLTRLLSPLAGTIIGWQGVDSSPHSVLAVGFKGPLPLDFLAGAERFTTTFQERLRRKEASLPLLKKLDRIYRNSLRTKERRRRDKAYYRAQFVVSTSRPAANRPTFVVRSSARVA